MDAEIARLIAAARALIAPIAAVEAQWEEDPSVSGGWRIDLCVIVERPGPEHARYRSIRLGSPSADVAAGQAQALAAALGAPATVTSAAERCGLDGSRWIAAQPPALADFVVRWEARTWTDDGERVEESATTPCTATSGHEACRSIERAVADRLGAAARPVDVRARTDDGGRWWWWNRHEPRPPLFATIADLRQWHVDGRSLAAIAADLRDRAPDTLSLMRALSEAFAIPLLDLSPLADHAAGRITARALDEALDPMVVDKRRIWDRPRRLRATHQRGDSLAAALRAERDAGAGTIELIMSLRDAFGLSLAVAKSATDRRSPADDASVDAELAAAMAERSA